MFTHFQCSCSPAIIWVIFVSLAYSLCRCIHLKTHAHRRRKCNMHSIESNCFINYAYQSLLPLCLPLILVRNSCSNQSSHLSSNHYDYDCYFFNIRFLVAYSTLDSYFCSSYSILLLPIYNVYFDQIWRDIHNVEH